MAQSRQVADAMVALAPGLKVDLVPVLTRADRAPGPLAEIGGKGLFTAELEEALRSGEIHLAVHSGKDVPAAMPPDLTIAAVPRRADARDALVRPGGGGPDSLPQGATVGTSSLRRRAQLLAERADLNVVPIRGNVETRLNKALDPDAPGKVDAVVLAVAGLIRSGLDAAHADSIWPLDVGKFVPAAGQGALALQTLADPAGRLAGLLAALDHAPSHQAFEAERAVLRGLGADCRSCVAVHVARRGDGWRGRAMVARSDGSDPVRLYARGDAPAEVADSLLADLDKKGAVKLLGP